MLMNQKYDSVNCFSLILCGEPYLNHILEKQVNEALRQRIVVHYNFHGLTDQEVSDYIRQKIRNAGGSSDIIDTAAISSVHSYSQGNPRLIDNVMTDAMTLGMQKVPYAIVQSQGHQIMQIQKRVIPPITLQLQKE